MEDPYRSSDSEDISSFLQVLLHNPPSDAAASPAGGGYAPVEKYFSDLRNFEADGFHGASVRARNFVSSCEESDASENRSNPGHPRCSSKRSRAAEVHNLSEKRRRSRINEKLKALQSLIPNSNKTDKASMLDEAIEYLKQLQLQVQMLMVRTGVSLHPGYSLGGPSQPTQVPQPELISRNSHLLMQNDMENVGQSYPTPQMIGPYSHSGFQPGFENRYLDFNNLDISCSRSNPSPGVSS